MIEVSDLSKDFGKSVAVDHLSLTVEPGSVSGFLGPNGAGKSAAMRMILDLDNPSSGTGLIDGAAYAHLHRPLTKVGSLLDANCIHPNRWAQAPLTWMAVSNPRGPAAGDAGARPDRAHPGRRPRRRQVLPWHEAAAGHRRRAARRPGGYRRVAGVESPARPSGPVAVPVPGPLPGSAVPISSPTTGPIPTTAPAPQGR